MPTDPDVHLLSPYGTGVQSVHFTTAGTFDAKYGTKGVFETATNGTDVDYAGVSFYGITPQGSVLGNVYRTSSDSDEPTGSSKDFAVRINVGVTPLPLGTAPGTAAEFKAADDGSLYAEGQGSSTVTHYSGKGKVTATYMSAAAFSPAANGSLLTVGFSSRTHPLALIVTRYV